MLVSLPLKFWGCRVITGFRPSVAHPLWPNGTISTQARPQESELEMPGLSEIFSFLGRSTALGFAPLYSWGTRFPTYEPQIFDSPVKPHRVGRHLSYEILAKLAWKILPGGWEPFRGPVSADTNPCRQYQTVTSRTLSFHAHRTDRKGHPSI